MKHTKHTTKRCPALFASIALFELVAGPVAAQERLLDFTAPWHLARTR